MTQRIFTLLFAQFFLLTCVFGQVYQSSKVKKYQSLTDEVYLFPLFVDTDKDNWQPEEREYYLEELKKSQSWLQEQARPYGQRIEFNDGYFMRSKDLIYIGEVSRENPQLMLSKVMEELNYKDFEDFCQQNNFDFQKNKLKFILFVKSINRSHAYDFWSNTQVDIAVIYSSSRIGVITDEYVISHEILHQFGAWDLYHEPGRMSLENAQRAKELYPNSIMISTFSRKDELEVDELTAWRVGWHNDFKEEYQEFNPRAAAKPASERRPPTSLKFDLRKKQD